ncbi:hypothetical protein O0L34_g2149 [Tuta absoluta]|nr:hypothetical protein O0L34_g2149 [Tuta absoluta]
MNRCPKCEEDFTNGVTCSKCGVIFCFVCANISETNYRKLGPNKQGTLLCKECKHGAPVGHSAGTPTPSPADLVLEELRHGIACINKSLLPLPGLFQDVKYLKESFASFEQSIFDLQTKVITLNEKNDALATRIITLESKPDNTDNYLQLEKKVSSLNQEISIKEQWLRLNNLEIKGIPLQKNENLFDIICAIGIYIQYPITKEQINFVSRVQSADKNKPVIVCFTSRYTKENFIAKARSHRELTARDVGFHNNAGRVYINDHLTRENKILLNQTKEVANGKGYQFKWVQQCKILVRKNETSPILHIQTSEDLKKIQ